MFTTNQIMNISGTLDKLAPAIDFALRMSGHANDIAWQVSGNTFVIGYTAGRQTEGWNQYNHGTSTKKIAKDICRFLKEQELKPLPQHDKDTYWDRGFLMTLVDDSGEKPPVTNGEYALVRFEPYDCYYKMR